MLVARLLSRRFLLLKEKGKNNFPFQLLRKRQEIDQGKNYFFPGKIGCTGQVFKSKNVSLSLDIYVSAISYRVIYLRSLIPVLGSI